MQFELLVFQQFIFQLATDSNHSASLVGNEQYTDLLAPNMGNQYEDI